MSQRPRKPLGSYFRNTSNVPAQPASATPPRKPTGSYLRPPGSEALPQPVLVPPMLTYGSVILGLDTDTGQPVTVSQDDLCQGCYIVGVTGMGKSSLLEQIFYQQAQRDEAVIVIDPHGDLVDSLVAHIPAHRLAHTYLLDLTDRAYPFGLNAFVCSDPADPVKRDETRNQIMHAFGKLWPEIVEGQYVKIYLAHIVITLIEHPELTLANVERLLDDADYRKPYTRNLKNTRTREFWQQYERKSEQVRARETSPLRGRLDQLLTEPVVSAILKQTRKLVNIRELIEERAILLVKLPVNEEAYQYSASVIGTLLMSMIYAATFSFADIPNINDRPGFTLIVDEFQNFATDEYAKLFEQGRKYKVKQFLAHQLRQQLEREQKGRTNLAATLSANTKIAFRLTLDDARELASLFTGIAERRRPTDIVLHPLEKIEKHKDPTVKQFVLDVVDKLDKASGGKLDTERGGFYSKVSKRFVGYSYKVDPSFDFGAGAVQVNPDAADEALNKLDRLIYESEERGEVDRPRRQQFIDAVTPFWKLASDKPDEQYLEARERRTRFVLLLDTVLNILINDPIANDATLSNAAIAGQLERLEKRHAFVKVGATAYPMETRDTRLLQEATPVVDAARRLTQVREQTRASYCVPRSELEREEEEEETRQTIPVEPQPELEPVEIEMQAEEPIADSSKPEIPQPEPLPKQEPEQMPPERIPGASRDSMNMLYAQLKARDIDPDTTILAALGEHYVLTIKQWMRLFERSALPKATPYFKTLREQGYIYRKDREGRGGSLVTGDWFFLLTKGANELVRRKQPSPQFTLEPNEAAKAAGDTLVHTSLVNELLIHLRLLERQYPNIITIEKLVHERSMRREYLAALGSDAKLYPDGFLRLLVPTPNGLKKRYLFLELQHTTQKDKQNWQSKIRKYLDLFAQEDTLTQFFATRTPRVLVLVMDEAYITYHKQWTEEVLQQAGDRGKRYSNRFLIGSYDPGIADNTMQPLKFFCTPRFSVPFNETTSPLFYRVK